MKTKCDYFKCSKTAHWAVETSYSLVCLCTTHIGIKYLLTAAKIEPIHRETEFKTKVVDTPTQ